MRFATCIVLGIASLTLCACSKEPPPAPKLAPPTEPEYGYQEMPATNGQGPLPTIWTIAMSLE